MYRKPRVRPDDFTSTSHRLTFSSSSQEFPTPKDAIDFDQKIRRAIGLPAKEEATTLSDDANAAVVALVV